MLLFFLRHADPVYSPDGLTPQGERQAEALARRLSTFGLDKIYASSSNRAILTARPTSELVKRDIEILDWCNEGHAWRELTVLKDDGYPTWCFAHPKTIELFRSNDVRALGNKWYEYPGFEKFKGGYLRIRNEAFDFLRELGYSHDDERNGYVPIRPNDDRVALFAHQGFGLSFLSCIMDIPFPTFTTTFDMQHSGMTVIDFSGKGDIIFPRILQLSNDSHLYHNALPTWYNNGKRI